MLETHVQLECLLFKRPPKTPTLKLRGGARGASKRGMKSATRLVLVHGRIHAPWGSLPIKRYDATGRASRLAHSGWSRGRLQTPALEHGPAVAVCPTILSSQCSLDHLCKIHLINVSTLWHWAKRSPQSPQSISKVTRHISESFRPKPAHGFANGTC